MGTRTRYIIKDWAGNIMFNGKGFYTFEAADDYLTAQIEKMYPDTKTDEDHFSEERGEYEIEADR